MYLRSKTTNKVIAKVSTPDSVLGTKPNGETAEFHMEYCYIDNSIEAEAEFQRSVVENDKKTHNDKVKRFLKKHYSKGFKRNLRDEMHLPAMPWSMKAIKKRLNDPDQERSMEKWSLEENLKLKYFWDEMGYATAEEWKIVSENCFSRSLYGIECELRFIAAEDAWEELEKYLEKRGEENE